MGSRKSGILEKIKEGDQIGREAVEAGGQLEGDGSEIKSLLDGIDTSMDEDDTAAVRQAESGYSEDFKAAFREDVETRADEMEKTELEAVSETGAELEKVNEAADTLQEIAGITDVGRSNAEGAADAMRGSAEEYETYISEANEIVDETEGQIDSLKSSIDSIFG